MSRLPQINSIKFPRLLCLMLHTKLLGQHCIKIERTKNTQALRCFRALYICTATQCVKTLSQGMADVRRKRKPGKVTTGSYTLQTTIVDLGQKPLTFGTPATVSS